MSNNNIPDISPEIYDDAYYKGMPSESCPMCGRGYDDIEFDYQWCSKCGWDNGEQKWDEKREPTDEDFENGDADILTGEFN